MKKEVYDKDKLICIWLSHEDQQDVTVQKKLTQIFEKYRPMKYLVTVFYSGKESLEALIGDLLRYNRKALEKSNRGYDKKTKNGLNVALTLRDA